MPYARAKIVAEGIMRKVSETPSFEVVVLRPGIVWGPRSRWSFNAALELKENRAFMVGDGSGICNSIYIDNLVASILVCCSQESEVSGFYNVADDEVVTWRDFYASLSKFLHYDIASIPKVNSNRFKPTFETMLQDIKSSDLYSKLKKSIPLEKREIIKQWLAAYQRKQKSPPTDKNKHQSKVFISREMWHLQTTKHKLPTKKFEEKFNFTPPVSFQDGMQMTINWLRFVGF
jgi:nucleoside-diphosphate-sugar epimerase